MKQVVFMCVLFWLYLRVSRSVNKHINFTIFKELPSKLDGLFVYGFIIPRSLFNVHRFMHYF